MTMRILRGVMFGLMSRLMFGLLMLLAAGMVYAQPARQQFTYTATDPAGACANGQANQYNYVLNKEWGCNNSVWTVVASGGGGGGGSPAGSAVTDAQCWASASTFGVCANVLLTTVNKITLTAPATGSTLTIVDGKTFTASNTLTLAGTDGSTLNIGAGGTLGSNAFTSTAYAPLASPTFTGTVTNNGSYAGSAIMPVANGGTALASGTSGGILGYTASGTLASSIAGVAGAMMTWAGAGATPTSPLSLLVTSQNAAGETWTLNNTTASTGVTQFNITAGAGQSTTPLETITYNALGTTQRDGFFLSNTTAAAVGAQQISPSLKFQAAGWNTTATAASNTVFGYIQLLGVQGTSTGSSSGAGVDGLLQFQTKIGAGSVTNLMHLGQQFGQEVFGSTPIVTMWLGTAAATTLNWNLGNDGTNAYVTAGGGTGVALGTRVDSIQALINSSGIRVASNGTYTFTSSGGALGGGAADVSLDRDGVGILGVVNATQGTTAANYRAIKASAHYIGGTTFTASGCSNGTLTGGSSAGTFTLGANSCNVVVTMGNSATAPNGWSCRGNDQTAPTILIPQSASSTTTATFAIPAGAGASDVINFACIGY